MNTVAIVTAFAGERLLASGCAAHVAIAVKAAQSTDPTRPILIFENATGRQVDFDLRGSDDEVAARLPGGEPPSERKGPGRPRLGVVAREVTLLPRHWEWLARQPGGASVALRKLVDQARNTNAELDTVRSARQAADRFMLAMLGDRPGFEDAARALYAGQRQRFEALTENWPVDLRDHARHLAAPAFAASQ